MDALNQLDDRRPLTKWSDAWAAAVTRPSITNFARIAAASGGDIWRPVRWVLAGTGLVAIVVAAFGWLRGAMPVSTALVVALAVPLGACLWLLFSSLTAHWVARRSHGEGTLPRLMLTYAAIDGPALIALTFIYAGPVTYRCLSLAVIAYSLVLKGLAVRAVYQASGGRAVMALLPSTFLILLIPVAAVFVLINALRG